MYMYGNPRNTQKSTYILTTHTQSLLHCYALDCVTHFMFSPGGLKSLDNAKDFEIMHELTYHQSLQSKHPSEIYRIAR